MENYLQQFTSSAIAYAPKVLLAIVTLILGLWIANTITRFLARFLQLRNVDGTVIPFLTSIVNTLLKIMVLISVAGIFGIQTTSFVAILGAAGLAVGLALQGSLSHFASGVMLLTFRPYKVGDLVTVAGFTGEVEELQVFNTVLRTLDNKKIIIPNGSVTAGPITNISGQGRIRVDMQVGISAAEDIDKVKRVVQQVADSCPYILKDPKVDVLVNSMEVGITKFDVRPWCKSEHYWDVYYYMQENMKRQFGAQGIIAPKPAMDVSIINK